MKTLGYAGFRFFAGVISIIAAAGCNLPTGGSSQSTSLSSTALMPPVANFVSQPQSLINSRSVSVSFSATLVSGDAIDHYLCNLNGASAYRTCPNPYLITGMADGNQQLMVKAVDTVGNASAPITALWSVDATPPTALFNLTPSSITNQTSASFVFSASDALSGVVSIQCALDSAAYSVCVSPMSYTGLAAGAHSLNIRSLDKAGNYSVVATYPWVVNLSAPTVTIATTPAAVSNSASATFTFSGSDALGNPITVFNCTKDGSTAQCSSPATYTGLAAGNHTFSVKGTDVAGNISAAAAFNWMVDLTPPTVSISFKPASPTNLTTASFQFTATDTGSGVAGIQCSLDGGTFAACTSPASFSGLAAGSHSFALKATDRAGNVSAATTVTWVIDLTAPVVTISSEPTNPSTSTSASFAFSAPDTSAISGYQCALDAGAFAACTSPMSYSGLSAASHTFSVKATDAAGNFSTPVTYTWIINAASPSPTPSKSATPSPTPSKSVTPSPTPSVTNAAGGCDNQAVVYAYNNGNAFGWGDFDGAGASTNYQDSTGTPPTGTEDAKTTVTAEFGEWLYHAPCFNSSCAATATTPQYGINITGCNFMYISLKEGALPANWTMYAILDFPSDTPTGAPGITVSDLAATSQGNGWTQYKVPLYPTINGANYSNYFFTGPSQTELPDGTNTFYKFGIQDHSGASSNYWYGASVYFSAN